MSRATASEIADARAAERLLSSLWFRESLRWTESACRINDVWCRVREMRKALEARA
jgi:hypothetical protein